ncbi:hypothetical protein GCM10023166_08990 [Paeniglutamicibacter cryotolerans]
MPPEPRNGIGQETGVKEPRIIVKKTQELPGYIGHPGISSGRDANVLLEEEATDPRGKPDRVPAVANDHHVEVHRVLGHQGGQGTLEFIGSVSHGQDNDTYRRLPARFTHLAAT